MTRSTRFTVSSRARGYAPGRIGTALVFVALALALLPFADLGIAGHAPWAELRRMVSGLMAPDFGALESLARTAGLTVAFALCGVALGAACGFALAPLYRLGPVRLGCVAIRAVHELFWAILLMQVTGLSASIAAQPMAAQSKILIVIPSCGPFRGRVPPTPRAKIH